MSEQQEPQGGYIAREEIGYRSDGPFTAEQKLYIQEAVEKALYPGTVDPRRFASVTFTLDTGERFRGVVYGVERVEDEK